MKFVAQKRWTLLSILGLLYWFFGNLYEAIVFSPNWIIDSPEQFERLNAFFILTGPTVYFVPLTQIATVLVWVIYWRNREPSIRRELKWASIFAILATLLNILIVSTIVIKLFGADFAHYGGYLSTLAWRWNILNVCRMGLVITTVYFLFQSYRKLDRKI